MKKYFVITDVHSFYTEMVKALTEKGFELDNPEHIVISCGDMFDRGDESQEVLQFLCHMLKENRIYCIMGNHEILLQQAIKYGVTATDIYNGTAKTIQDLSGVGEWGEVGRAIVSNNVLLKHYLRNCKNYLETEHYIFVHSWIPNKSTFTDRIYYEPSDYDPDWRSKDANWQNAVWGNPFKQWNGGVREPGKTIVCGHWHTSWAHYNIHGVGVEWKNRVNQDEHFEPFYDDGIIGLDACTAYSGFCNCIVLTEEELGCIVE